MDPDFADLLPSSDEELFEVHIRRPYTLRERTNHFARWDELDFFRRFRLTKVTVQHVLNRIENAISHGTNRNGAVTPINQLLMTLRFYAAGNAYTAVGDFVGVHKSTAALIIRRVSQAICRLRPEYVRFPRTRDEIIATKQHFYGIARFPRLLGAIDCTHIRIKSPGGNNVENFRNRKGYFSLNVQASADSQLKILDIVARWPGSTHDFTIFNNSRLKGQFENGEFGNSLMVGDSGYAVKRYLITPLGEPETSVEQLFNKSQIRPRNVVERTFGVWKKRFPILSVGLETALPLLQDIIVATAVLHNLACMNNEDVPPDDPEVVIPNRPNHEPYQHQQNNIALPDNAVRHALIHDYFARLL